MIALIIPSSLYGDTRAALATTAGERICEHDAQASHHLHD
jgi:hypothetical protein